MNFVHESLPPYLSRDEISKTYAVPAVAPLCKSYTGRSPKTAWLGWTWSGNLASHGPVCGRWRAVPRCCSDKATPATGRTLPLIAGDSEVKLLRPHIARLVGLATAVMPRHRLPADREHGPASCSHGVRLSAGDAMSY